MTASVFPPGGGGTAFTRFKTQYVDPNGSNSAAGNQFSPKKTAAAAYLALAPGGSIYIASHSKWSDGTEGHGLVDGQGCWLTGGNGANGVMPTGWLQAKPCNFYGYGLDVNSQLGMNYALMDHWGDNDGVLGRRTNPGFWLTRSGEPVRIQDIKIIASNPWRLGWDYRRNVDGAIAWGNIASATRTGGFTTFTVDFPPGYTVTHGGRSGGLVTLRFTCAAFLAPFSFSPAIDWVNITSADPNFDVAPHAWQLFQPVTALSSTTFQLQYNDGGSDVTFGPVVGAVSVNGHACNAFNEEGDIIEVESTDSNWPSTMYMVTGVTATTITVTDPYGANHGPTANMGRYVLQDRVGGAISFDQMHNCSGQLNGYHDAGRTNAGPTIDRGSQSAGQWSWIFDGEFAGGHFNAGGDVEGCKDPNRGAAHFFSPGSKGNIGFFQFLSRFHLGAIRGYGGLNAPWFVTARDMMHQWDVNMGAIPATPCFQVAYRGTVAHLDIDNCTVADGVPVPADVDLGFSYGVVNVTNSTVANSIGSLVGGSSVPWIGPSKEDYVSQVLSLRAQYMAGIEGNDGRIVGKRDDVPGSFGVVQYPGYSNLVVNDLSSWTDVGTITLTASQSTAGLDGSGKAFKIHCSAGGSGGKYYDATTPAAAAGDTILFGCWMKQASGEKLRNGAGAIAHGVYQNTTPTTAFDLLVPFGGNGEWQWITLPYTVLTGSTNIGKTTLRISLDVVQSHDTFFYGPTLLFIPASAGKNEAYRILHSFRSQPPNLAAGMAGTMPGVKAIGYAGFGTDSANAKAVGVGSGQLTLTGSGTVYLPMYDLDGTTIIGWVAQLQASINP